MSFARPALALLGAALGIALATPAASAATAYAGATVNVRSGPGTSHGVVDVLDEGQRVEVDYCKGLWCFVEKPGPDGWVNANYLTQDYWDDEEEDDDGEFYITRPARPHVHFRPFYRSQACVSGPNASFCIGD